MFEFTTHETPLRTTIKEYACISVIEEKRTRNHRGVSYCFVLPYCQHSSYAAIIPCLRSVPLVVSSLTTTITRLAHTDPRDLGDWSCRCLTETGSVPLLAAVVAVHLLTISIVVEIALAALREVPSISLYWCGGNRSSSGGSSGMDCHNLLLLGRFL